MPVDDVPALGRRVASEWEVVNGMRWTAALLIALASAVAFADELTLRQAIDQALELNPQVRMANAREQQSSAALRETRAMWLPRVDLSETVMSSNNPVFVFGSLLEQGRFGPQNFDPRFLNAPSALHNYRLGLNVRFTVFDQFRRLEAMRQASNGVAQSQAGVDEAKQAIRLDVMSKFYGLLIAQARHAVATEAVKSAESDAAAMREKFRQGVLVGLRICCRARPNVAATLPRPVSHTTTHGCSFRSPAARSSPASIHSPVGAPAVRRSEIATAIAPSAPSSASTSSMAENFRGCPRRKRAWNKRVRLKRRRAAK